MTESILRDLMAKRGLTQVQLAKDLDVSRQSIARWLAGHTIDEKNLKKLSEYFSVPEAMIRYGSNGRSVLAYEDGDEPPEDVVVIKEYKLAFGASPSGIEAEPQWVVDEHGEDFWYKRSFFQRRQLNPDRCKRATVHGDSMEPTICDGDKILFYEETDPRPGCVLISDGRIYAISIDGLLKVKRLSKAKDGIIVRSDNAALYGPEVFSGEDVERMRIFGRVIEVTRTI